jgi:L-ascorbate metabolism protein UlaG (beta-lactamase superfamily)
METVFTYNGHANLSLEISGYKLLVDPWFIGNPSVKINVDEVVADYVLVTHAHYDHLGQTVEILQRTGATCISNPEICLWVEKQGLKVHIIQMKEEHDFPFGCIKTTKAEHGSAFKDGSAGGDPVGFVVKTSDMKTIYLAGDTRLFKSMTSIGKDGFDLAVLPIGGHYTMDPDDALEAVKLLKPKKVVPIHYDTFDLIKQDPHAWKNRVEAETSTKVFVLQPDDSIIV